jgi:hypothetical protein
MWTEQKYFASRKLFLLTGITFALWTGPKSVLVPTIASMVPSWLPLLQNNLNNLSMGRHNLFCWLFCLIRQLQMTPSICPRADGAKRRARVLIPHGYLHPGVWEHSEVQSCPPLCDGRSSTLCISLFYNIFFRCILLLTGHKPAVSWISGCQPWNNVWKACINTNFVEDEPDVFQKWI